MKWMGKTLEMIGMVIVAAGFLYGVLYSLIKFELGALVIGSMVFFVGWRLEKRK
jgi:inner membrane protein involved in colicin E2 resistance